ncbi:MAG: glycosyltransferase [bacterium]|nr:glycosyltransferase [bacterium]
MCDILFLVASYGTGHIKVALALQSAILSLNPNISTKIVDFIDLVDPYLNEISQWIFMMILKYYPSLWGRFFKRTENISLDSFRHNFLNIIGSEKLIDLLKKEKPRVIVCTYPIQVGVLSRLKRLGIIDIPVVSVVTDIAVHSFWLHPYVDLYIVANRMAKEILISKGVPAYKVKDTGIPIEPKFAEPVDIDRAFNILELKRDIPVVSAMMGGYGLESKLIEVTDVLLKLDLPFQGVIVTGRNEKLRKSLLEKVKGRNHIRVFGYIEYNKELLAVSNVFITKAGAVTISEALAMETPMILYGVIPGHEEENAQFLLNNNVALIAYNPLELEEKIRLLLTNKNLVEKMKALAKNIKKPDSAIDGAKLILSLLYNNTG